MVLNSYIWEHPPTSCGGLFALQLKKGSPEPRSSHTQMLSMDSCACMRHMLWSRSVKSSGTCGPRLYGWRPESSPRLQMSSPEVSTISFDERLALLVEGCWSRSLGPM